MTIKNGDMPAMPMFSHEAKPGVIRDAETKDVGYSAGLTKREMMAMHMMAELMNQYGEFSSAQSQAKCAIKAADALIAELECTK